MKFTQESVARLKLPPGKSDHIEWDNALPGFGVRLRKGSKGIRRSYILQYKIGSRHRRLLLGDAGETAFDIARAKAKVEVGRVASARLGHGTDPAVERDRMKEQVREEARPKPKTHGLGEVFEDYLRDRQPKMKPRSHEETARHLRRHFAPLHRLELSGVERADVAAQVRAIGKVSGPIAANRSRASLSAFFRWAIGEGLCDNNPVTGTNKHQESGPRERSLTDAEAAAVWLACPETDYGHIVRLILLTACRRTEMGGLKWSEIDFNAQTITIPGDRTKNGQKHVVPSKHSRSCKRSLLAPNAILCSESAKAAFPAGRNRRQH